MNTVKYLLYSESLDFHIRTSWNYLLLSVTHAIAYQKELCGVDHSNTRRSDLIHLGSSLSLFFKPLSERKLTTASLPAKWLPLKKYAKHKLGTVTVLRYVSSTHNENKGKFCIQTMHNSKCRSLLPNLVKRSTLCHFQVFPLETLKLSVAYLRPGIYYQMLISCSLLGLYVWSRIFERKLNHFFRLMP